MNNPDIPTYEKYLNEALENASSVPDAIRYFINSLRKTGKFEDAILANSLERYLSTVCNPTLQNKLIGLFSDLYDKIDEQFPSTLFRIEGRTKSLLSALKKLIDRPIGYTLKDDNACRLIVFSEGDDAISMCYSIAKLTIELFVKQGYIPCFANKTPANFISAEHPEVQVPIKSELPLNYQQFFEDYMKDPKDNAYQSLHVSFETPEGHYFEFQIRSIKMHHHAEFGAANHSHYKKASYDDLFLDRDKITIPGYLFIHNPDGSSQLYDYVGVEESVCFLRRQKTHV